MITYAIAKRNKFEVVQRGRSSQLSGILQKIKTLAPDDAIIIVPDDPNSIRAVYNRMKSNVSKWKERHGIPHISVHLTKNGKVALYRESK